MKRPLLLSILLLANVATTHAAGVTVTLSNEFEQGSFTACFDANGEVIGIHCAKPGQTVTKKYRWSPKILKLQLRSGHLTNNPEKSFLYGDCTRYFPDVTYIDAWPKYSAKFKTNAPQVTIRIWPGPLNLRHYGGYRYAATTWACSWDGIDLDFE